jgi:Beta-propeller repeat
MSRRTFRVPLAFVVALLPAAAFLSCSANRTVLKASGTVSSKPASLQERHASTGPDSEKRVAVTRALERMPLYFIENRGQLDSRVAYYVQGRDTTLYFTADGMTLVKTEERHERDDSKFRLEKVSLRQGIPQTQDPVSRWVVKLDFVGANPNPKIEAADPTPAVVSYFKGPKENWKAGLSTYGSIVYSDLWPGIDLVYSGTADRLKYTFLVKPGADPDQVRLAYRGARDVRLNDAGQLEVETPVGVLQDDRPYAYQEVEGRRVEVSSEYSLDRASADGPLGYGFALGSYDHSKPLVLDPAVFVYCGYIGGGGFGVGDAGQGIAVDSSGNAYVTGYTYSSEATFPVTVGPDLTYNGGTDAFVAKVKADGTGLVYCGYIGGSGADIGYGIAVDSSGNAYITGQTASSEATFPVTVGPDLSFNGGVPDAFVAKVNAAGTALLYCGYIGGSGYDIGYGIAVDSSGNAYVTGSTSSDQATFPVKVGPDLTFNGSLDTFVAKVNVAGTALDYCGYIGGTYNDIGYGIAVDSSGNAYVTGVTSNNQTTFPVTVGPDLTENGLVDAFVAKVKADGTGLVYCGYIGGNSYDYGYGIAVDSSGNAYVTGKTTSTEATFPVTVGPDLTYNGGTEDAFVAKVNAAGTALVYCGYIGGFGADQGNGIAVDSAGNAYVTGQTGSSEATFPVTGGPDLTYGDNVDAFVAKVNAAGTALVYCGYIGGSGADYGYGIAVDSAGNAYVTGQTGSSEATFPVTVGPDLTYNGGSYGDAFVAKIGTDATAAAFLPSSARAPGAGGAFYTTDVTIANTGGSDTQLTLKFLGNNKDGSGGAERSFPLAAGRSTTYADILGSVFGETSNFGAIRISSSLSSFVVLGQTSTPGFGGTFGQSVPAARPSDLITSGAPRSIVGVREDGAFRTNLILSNATSASLDVDVALFADTGASLGNKRYTLAPLGMTQVTRVVRDVGFAADVRGARVVLSTPTPGGSFAAYASDIDNITNDPRTLLPKGPIASPQPTNVWFLPSSARAPGAGGAFYTTDLLISNTGATDTTIALKFLGHDQDGTGGSEQTFALAAGKTVTYADVLGSVFGVSSGFGAIRIASPSAALNILGQTSTPGFGGTFGQSVPASAKEDLIVNGSPRSLVAVREDPAFRTNVILCNTTAASLDVDATLVASSGLTLVSKRYTLPPLGMTQVTRIVRDMQVAGDVIGARLVLSTPTSGGAFAAYASAIDNTTNDPRTLLPK